MKKVFIIAACMCLVILGCSKSKDSGTVSLDCSVAKSFVTDVNPIIQSSCATNSSCHGAGSNNGPGALTNYSQVFNARSAIRSAVITGKMPQNSSLSTAQINNIVCWIDNGSNNN